MTGESRFKHALYSPQFLQSRDSIEPHIDDISIRALQTYVRETLLRKRAFADIIQGPDGITWKEHFARGIQLVYAADKAERASNGLFGDLIWSNLDPTQHSVFGTRLHKANENPNYDHHNKDHVRRTEELAEGMLVNIPDIRKVKVIFPWIPSLMLAIRWHDEDQVYAYERNVDRRRQGLPDLDTKIGHGLADAVMLLAVHRRYAVEANVRPGDAWFMCAGAAVMMMDHGEPETYERALAARGHPWRIDKRGKKRLFRGSELLKGFHSYEIDRFAIAPTQLIDICRREKERQGDADSRFGLPPDFEKEYLKELIEMSQDPHPLIRDIIENPERFYEWRPGFNLASELFIRSDEGDMYSPPYENLLRTLATQRSEHRAFFRIDDIQGQYTQITEGPGSTDKDDSDTRRELWELTHIDGLSSETMIGKSKHVTRFNKDNAIMGLLAFRKFGSEIIHGNYDSIRRIYDMREEQIGTKALKKTGHSSIGIVLRFLLYQKKTGQLTNEIEKEVRKRNPDMANSYRDRVYALRREKEIILSQLQKKNTYANIQEEAVRSFQQLCDMVLEDLCKKYNVSPKQLKRYKVKIEQWKYPSMPYGSYDSFGGKMRTLREPRG